MAGSNGRLIQQGESGWECVSASGKGVKDLLGCERGQEEGEGEETRRRVWLAGREEENVPARLSRESMRREGSSPRHATGI